MGKTNKNCLNIKHKNFVDRLFVNGFNQTEAYKVVYEIENIEYAGKAGARLMKNDGIKQYFQHKWREYREKLDINKDKMLDMLADELNLFQEMKNLATKSSLTKEEENKFRRLTILIKASDANKARDMINKLQGNYEPEQQIITHNVFNLSFDDVDDINETEEENED